MFMPNENHGSIMNFHDPSYTVSRYCDPTTNEDQHPSSRDSTNDTGSSSIITRVHFLRGTPSTLMEPLMPFDGAIPDSVGSRIRPNAETCLQK